MDRPRRQRYRIRPAWDVEREESAGAGPLPALPTPDDVALARYGKPRHALIAEAAYHHWLGGPGGDPLSDWLAAKREVDELLADF